MATIVPFLGRLGQKSFLHECAAAAAAAAADETPCFFRDDPSDSNDAHLSISVLLVPAAADAIAGYIADSIVGRLGMDWDQNSLHQ